MKGNRSNELEGLRCIYITAFSTFDSALPPPVSATIKGKHYQAGRGAWAGSRMEMEVRVAARLTGQLGLNPMFSQRAPFWWQIYAPSLEPSAITIVPIFQMGAPLL